MGKQGPATLGASAQGRPSAIFSELSDPSTANGWHSGHCAEGMWPWAPNAAGQLMRPSEYQAYHVGPGLADLWLPGEEVPDS